MKLFKFYVTNFETYIKEIYCMTSLSFVNNVTFLTTSLSSFFVLGASLDL